MKKQQWLLAGSAGLGAGLGAGLMYLLDPQGGGRRRALARAKAVHLLKKGGEAALKTSRDLGNRTKGLLAEARSSLRHEAVDDDILLDRVRSKIGRVVSGNGWRRLGRRNTLGAALGAASLGLLARNLTHRRAHAPMPM
jgi:hypothetical protein